MISVKLQRSLFLLMIAGLLLGFVSMAFADSGNIVKVGGDLTIEEGKSVRNAISIGGQITVDGRVENLVAAIGGSVVLTRTAYVGGNAISVGGVVAIGRGAEVHGNITEINLDNISTSIADALTGEWEGWSWIFAMYSLFLFIIFLLFALLIVHFIPKPIRVISGAIRDVPLKTIMWGTIGLILMVPLAVLLAISVIGVVLIPVEVVLVLCAVILGLIAVSQRVGEKIFTLFKKHDENMMMRETIWGLITLWIIIGWIPFIGLTVKALAIVVGLGGVIVTRFGTTGSR
jgi:hypothetical protein